MGEVARGEQGGGQRGADGDRTALAGPRAVALVGPFGSGKTTLLEAILARTGAIARQGRIGEGSTVGDGAREARAHAMSVEVNLAETDFMGDSYTFMDCPGSAEFLGESEGVLAGVDCAVVVCEADAKKVPALQLICKRLEDLQIPHLMFLNKIDKADARVREMLAMLQPASALPLVLRQIPIWQDGIVAGYIDLAQERAFVYREHAESEVIEIPDAERAREVEARFAMLETLADYDDALMEQLLEEMEPPRDLVFKDLAADMRNGLICPVMFGAAENGNGVSRLMKALRHETPGLDGLRQRLGFEAGGDGIVQILKTLHTSHGGKISLARVLSGEIGDGAVLTRADGSTERVSGLYRVFGQQMTKRETAQAGDTVALGKLEGVSTGETLTTNRTPRQPLARLAISEPVMALAIQASERKDEVKLSAALAKLQEEDPSIAVLHPPETGETVLTGQGEMHLRVTLERLEGKFGLSIASRPAAVAYLETIRGATSLRGRHKKQSGGHGQFADVVLDIRPLARGEGLAFSDTITGGVVPKQYIPAVEAGVRDALLKGPLGFRVVDVAVTLTDGSYHTVDSSDQAFQMAARLAMRDGLAACQPVLLEPIDRVEIACPSEATARINAIVSARRGQLMGFDARPGWPGWDRVGAMMPAAEIGDLIVELRSATQGVASFTRRFDHLQELSGRLAEEIVNRRAAA